MTRLLIRCLYYGPAWDVAIFIVLGVIIVVGARREVVASRTSND